MGLLNAPKFEEADDPSVGASTTSLSQSVTPAKGTKMATTTPTTKAVTGVVRGSYLSLFQAKLPQNAKEGDTPKYSMTVLIPKTDVATLAKLEAAREVAITTKWPGKRPAKIDTTLHDGDAPKVSNGEDYGDECKGHMVMAVASKYKPKILDRESNEIIDPAECGSGDYFKVSLSAYGYDYSGKRGVSFGLGNVLFWERGESLGGKSRAEDDFCEDLPQN
jgi:hypothetical protein